MLEQPKIIIISKFYQTHAKISKPTGATTPVKKVKEISSNKYLLQYYTFYKPFNKTAFIRFCAHEMYLHGVLELQFHAPGRGAHS